MLIKVGDIIRYPRYKEDPEYYAIIYKITLNKKGDKVCHLKWFRDKQKGAVNWEKSFLEEVGYEVVQKANK